MIAAISSSKYNFLTYHIEIVKPINKATVVDDIAKKYYWFTGKSGDKSVGYIGGPDLSTQPEKKKWLRWDLNPR